jgi:NAD(P)-dependent dehydrogenase (short-subunit alcohol dehydrogenase family)
MGQNLIHDVAIVTGAGRGIGRAIALSLAADGAAVGVLARTEQEIAKTALIRFSEGLATQLDGRGVRVFAVHPGVVRTRLLASYGLQLPEEWFVGPERAGSLCARLASGRYDALSGRFLGIDDDLDELLNRTDEIVARELYTLRIQA